MPSGKVFVLTGTRVFRGRFGSAVFKWFGQWDFRGRMIQVTNPSWRPCWAQSSTIRQVHELLRRQIGRLVSFEDRQDSFRRRKDKRQVRLNIRPRKLLVESLVLIDDFDYLAFRIKNGADSACPVVLF